MQVPAGDRIHLATPAIIQIALEAKGVMTEHKKARYNRLRDLQAFHAHAHQYDPNTIAAGIIVVNISPVFWSPTRSETDITFHKNITKIGQDTIETYRSLQVRKNPDDGPELEAASIVVIEHDNLKKNPTTLPTNIRPGVTALVNGPPAPQVGDPLHYATMIHRICIAYQERFA